MLTLCRGISYGEYAKVRIPDHDGTRGQSIDRAFQQCLFADCLRAVHRTPFRPHCQSSMQIVGNDHAQQGPVRLPILIGTGRISTAQFRGMRHTHGRAIQQERSNGGVGCRLTHLGEQLFKNVVKAFLHNGARQSLPCLIISSRMAGRSLAAFAPVLDAFTGAGPEAGRQPLEQL